MPRRQQRWRLTLAAADLGQGHAQEGVSETIYPLPGGKSVADFIKLAEDNGVRIIGCVQSLDLVGMTIEDLAQQLPMLTPGQALPALATAKRILTW
ncbi:MAG: DsrE/DsrF/DrsH-like family protein [Acidithiobacillus sp.]|uniref:DsrE/DsrF/DrsH-like family protein n=1 Tax=Acidithiobacillus sp. TaxID=1872118 RepID=UPI00355D26CE